MDTITGPRFVGTTAHTGTPGIRRTHLVRDTTHWVASCGTRVVEAIEYPTLRVARTVTCRTCRRAARLPLDLIETVDTGRPTCILDSCTCGGAEHDPVLTEIADEHGTVRDVLFAAATPVDGAQVVRLAGCVLYQLAVQDLDGTWQLLRAAYPHPESARAFARGALIAYRQQLADVAG